MSTLGFSGLTKTQLHFRSLSREEKTESGEQAGFLTNGSSPGFSPSPFWCATSGGHWWIAAEAAEAGFPITVAGPCGNLTHFPFTPERAPLFAFQRSTKERYIYHQFPTPVNSPHRVSDQGKPNLCNRYQQKWLQKAP